MEYRGEGGGLGGGEGVVANGDLRVKRVSTSSSQGKAPAAHLENVSIDWYRLLPSQREERHAIRHFPAHSLELHQLLPRSPQISIKLALAQALEVLPWRSLLLLGQVDEVVGRPFDERGAIAKAELAKERVGRGGREGGGRGEGVDDWGRWWRREGCEGR